MTAMRSGRLGRRAPPITRNCAEMFHARPSTVMQQVASSIP